jgi:sugar phosphate isomerase/epimerase
MKIALATHALRGYPPRKGGAPAAEPRRNLFRWATHHGFDGIEVGDWWFDFYTATSEEVLRLRGELQEFGLEFVGLNCLRKCVTRPAVAEQNRRDLRRAVEVAQVAQAKFVSVSLSLAPSASGVSEDRIKGLRVSPGGGKHAREEELNEAAAFLRELAEEAAGAGVEVALELHHCSLADTSQRLLRIMDLANHPNLSVNPDLGNVYWAYDVPEEPWYQAVERLAGRVNLWHVKNVQRIHVPEIERALFTHAPLDAGDIDYRWALGRMVEAGFDGYLSIEGAGPGDLLAFAARSKAYLDGLLTDLAAGIGLRVH